jgi:hypothetical protein
VLSLYLILYRICNVKYPKKNSQILKYLNLYSLYWFLSLMIKIDLLLLLNTYLISFFEHCKNKNSSECANHRSGCFRRESKACQNWNHQEINICCSCELKQKREWSPWKCSVFCGSNWIHFFHLLFWSGTVWTKNNFHLITLMMESTSTFNTIIKYWDVAMILGN